MTKPLLQRERKQLEQQNQARAMIGLSPLAIKLRKCNSCSCTFESVNSYYCKKCLAPKIATLSNHPII